MSVRPFWTTWLIVLVLGRASYSATPADCRIRLDDVTAATGIRFMHSDGGSGQKYIVESVVAGLATFDYDGDGWTDVFFLNGAPLKGTSPKNPPRHALYRNQGDWTFQEVTTSAGLDDRNYGLGVTIGDFDNDGDPDLFLNHFGPKVLYRNQGDGTFREVTRSAGLPDAVQVGAGACFLDIEGDGDLDLYAANYVDFNYSNHIVRKIGKYQFHPGPKDYRPVPDQLFRNEGDGTFTDISAASGIASVAGPGMGTICLDYDEDGDTDVFVCNDAAANFLFQNDGKGHFTEVAVVAGVAYDFQGKPHSNMGVDAADYDNDGRLDLFATSFSQESPLLFRNLGGGLFDDVTNVAKAGSSAFAPADWGAAFVDFDQDGDRDLFIACGHFNDNIHHIDSRTAVKVQNVLLMNLGNGRFEDVTSRCGSGLAVVESTRGAAFDDLDNDGDIDAVLLNANALPTILRNECPSENRALRVKLIGTQTNRMGVGARVRVIAGEQAQVAECHSGRGYQSHFGTTLHFGLGKQDRVEKVEVNWIGGERTTTGPVTSLRLLEILEKQPRR